MDKLSRGKGGIWQEGTAYQLIFIAFASEQEVSSCCQASYDHKGT